MQSDFENVYFEQSYGNFRSPLRHASDCLATFLTALAGRTVKKSPSPIGPGFETRRRQQKGHQSITKINRTIRNFEANFFKILTDF